MESMVHYKRLLLRNHSSASTSEALVDDCVRLLGSLRDLDPGRARRYDEIGEPDNQSSCEL